MIRYYLKWAQPEGYLTVVKIKGRFDSKFPKQFNAVNYRVIFSNNPDDDTEDSDEHFKWRDSVIDEKSVIRALFFGE